MDIEKLSGTCPICNKDAQLKCGNCKQVFYCKKDHQREDWTRHKSICRGWEIKVNKELGKHLVSSRDLCPGDVIISETPIIWGPAWHVTQRVCVGCGQKSKHIEARCLSCMWPACSPDCAGLQDKSRHGLECAFLARTNILPRCDLLLIIRMIILWLKKTKKWDILAKFESHENERGVGTEAYEEVQNVVDYLGPIVSVNASIKNILPRICGLIDVNTIETPPEGSVAFYEITCLMEHSCLPNTRYTFQIDEKGRPRITVKAITTIKKGDHLSTMYTHALWPTRVRRQHLLASKYFSCRCARCEDPTELDTQLGTLKCPCKEGFILPNNPLDFETEWSCGRCNGVLSSSEVANLIDKLEEQVEGTMSIARKETLSDLLWRLNELLHPNHQLCISVSHSLIQLLPDSDPKKPELCKRILDVITTLDPHGVRLSLYTATTLRELSGCPGEDKKLLLTQAINLLKNEPSNSPGEKLLKLIETVITAL